MEKIAEFEKVSFEQFKKDWLKAFPDSDNIEEIYNNIKLPVRATSGSAGYDFYAPDDVTLKKGVSTLIPTGIRSRIADGWVLNIFPRSGLGFKHRIQLDNTVGVIDADYYSSSNEGHIMIKLSCDAHDSKHSVSISLGEGIAQGIFMQFGITINDNADGIRDGGFGSTTKK